ncbi:MAG TPA: aminotransferase class V-fold PLP-dependent enzyme [Steroidobacteraceae bacterium]|nr:aminotransferase class V-fold PLP-dependent enzyme [Steroidobacteraceae bacterium]
MTALTLTDSEFRALAAQITELAAGYLAGLDGARAYPQVSGSEVAHAFAEALPETGLGAAALGALGAVLERSRAPTGRFYGYVLGSGEPVAALADLLASVLNQNVTAWRSAPAAVTIERQVVQGLAAAIGCAGFSGSLCGGGSMANLMGLAMAREARLPANEHGARPGVVYASSEVHMSIPKAMGLLGLGRTNLRMLPADADFRLPLEALRAAVQSDRAAGLEPLAVVASAGTVNTGSIDPLPEIGALCREQGLWLHVDGAYGALAALAVPERFAGLSGADSLSLDAHKWLYQPLDCGMLLFRDAGAARAAFSFTGDYAKSLSVDPLESFAYFDESLELSRRFRALKLWLSLRYHGLQAFREAIRADLSHAQQLARHVTESSELELLAPIALSAVCFRHRHGGEVIQGDRLNAAILGRLVERGRVYLSNATLHERFALRACFVNHRTTAEDVAQIVPEVVEAAREVAPLL